MEFFETPAFTRHLGAQLDDGDDHMATNTVKKRDLFGELREGVSAMQAQREGRITLRSHLVERLSLPRVDQQIIRSTRERLQRLAVAV